MSSIVLNKRFEVNLLKIIGRGEFGDTYLATDKKFKKEVAAKKIVSKSNMDSCGEVRIHSAFKHEHIVKMIDFSYVNGGLWIIYEKSSIGDLNRYFGSSTRDFSTIIHIAKQVCSAVVFLHEQDPPIFHRSIKPSYIIPFDDSDAPVVKLSGFARAIEYEAPMKTPELKPDEYKAPECHRKDGLWHLFSDIFSLGMVILAMLQHTDPSSGLYPLSAESIKDDIRDEPIGIEMMKAAKRGGSQPTIVELNQTDSEQLKTVKKLIKDMTVLEPANRKSAKQCLITLDKLGSGKQQVVSPEGHQLK